MPRPPPPNAKRFSGYWATHYRVQLREQFLTDGQKRYADARIEIQVASVLMHAWSEVEHDLVYKPMQGPLSTEEYDILDELNGLVIAGEIALKRLQAAGQRRIQGGLAFGNHYELAAFLLTNAASEPPLPSEQSLGDIATLYRLLVALDLAAPARLDAYLKNMHSDLERRPISEQIIDQLLAEDDSRYEVYQKVRVKSLPDEGQASRDPDLHKALGSFMSQWIAFEAAVRSKIHGGAERGPPAPSPQVLLRFGVIDAATAERLEPIRRLRNDVVHGVFDAPYEELLEAGRRLHEVTQRIANQ